MSTNKQTPSDSETLDEEALNRAAEAALAEEVGEPASQKAGRAARVVARSREESLALLEAVLFASAEPMTARELTPYVASGEALEDLLAALAEKYTDGGVRLERSGRAWAFRTAADYAARLKIERVRKRRISRAASETLAIVAYHQPITRGQIEEIRGVALSRGTLDILFEAGWVAPKGRAEQAGHPLLWGTTRAFLDHFQLARLEDLPAERELRASGLIDARAALAVVSEQEAEAAEAAQESEAAPESSDASRPEPEPVPQAEPSVESESGAPEEVAPEVPEPALAKKLAAIAREIRGDDETTPE